MLRLYTQTMVRFSSSSGLSRMGVSFDDHVIILMPSGTLIELLQTNTVKISSMLNVNIKVFEF